MFRVLRRDPWRDFIEVSDEPSWEGANIVAQRFVLEVVTARRRFGGPAPTARVSLDRDPDQPEQRLARYYVRLAPPSPEPERLLASVQEHPPEPAPS